MIDTVHRPLRVVIVNKHPNQAAGGSEIQCGLLADGLVARGHHVTYVAPHRVGRPVTGPPDVGYPVVVVPQWGRSIAHAVLNARPDVVYWRFNKRGLRVAAKRIHRSGIPFVFAVSHVNDLLPWSAKPVGGHRLRAVVAVPLLRCVSRWQHRGLTYATAMTTNNVDLLVRLTAPIRVYVPNGMVTDAAPFSWPRPFCLWVSSLKASKRPEAAVRLAAEIQDLEVDVLMVGGAQEPGHEAITDGVGLPDNLHYVGVRSLTQINGMFAAARVHVHTCLPEGFPNVFLQAWMQACPSVSLGFDPGGVITSEGLGADADDDWGAFVSAVRTLLVDDASRDERAARAQSYALREHAVDTMVERIETVFTQVTGAA